MILTSPNGMEVDGLEVFLSPDGSTGMAGQIYQQLRDAITERRLPPGTRLTATRALAADLGVSRSTVSEAYGRLVAEGYAEGRRGGGTIVAETAVAAPSTPSPGGGARPTPAVESVDRYGTQFATRCRYDLTAGRVDPRLFPLQAWRRCMREALQDRSDLVAYGDPAGSPGLRAAVASWVSRSRGVLTGPDRVVVTQGATQAIDLLTRTLLRPGDVVAMEEPGYPPVATVLQAHGVQVVGVPVDDEGLVVDALPPQARLVHVTPSHQYPLGVVMSHRRRLALLAWAGRHDAVVVEDDYDSEFRHGRRPLEPLQRLDRTGRVVYVGTFSKAVSPSLRMGFLTAPTTLVPAVVALRQATDFGPPTMMATALRTFITDGHLDRHLRRGRRTYTERHHRLVEAVGRTPGLQALPSQAGLHVAVVAPDAPPDEEIVARAESHGMLLSTLRRTFRTTDPVPGVVLGFGALATEDVDEAVAVLARCLSPVG